MLKSFGFIPINRIVELYGSFRFGFLKKPFSKVTLLIPKPLCKKSLFSTALLTLVVISLFDNSYSNKHKVQMYVTDIYRNVCTTATKHTFFSSAYVLAN